MPPVLICEHTASWRAEFERTATELRSVLEGDDAAGLVIEHIGSTAVPGLCAKPVIDIAVGVTSLHVIEALMPRLRGLGFRYRPEHEAEIPERRYFVRDPGSRLRIHLHALVVGGMLWRRHLAFRDALRRDDRLASEYATLKRQLALLHADAKSAYTLAKAPFIARVLVGQGEA
jgi:GrpB-like predicted nucleotidyltransferase (UPF0157 family)